MKLDKLDWIISKHGAASATIQVNMMHGSITEEQRDADWEKEDEIAKQAIEAYIAEREKLARIDEIKYLADDDMLYIDMDSWDIKERLDHLSKKGTE